MFDCIQCLLARMQQQVGPNRGIAQYARTYAKLLLTLLRGTFVISMADFKAPGGFTMVILFILGIWILKGVSCDSIMVVIILL